MRNKIPWLLYRLASCRQTIIGRKKNSKFNNHCLTNTNITFSCYNSSRHYIRRNDIVWIWNKTIAIYSLVNVPCNGHLWQLQIMLRDTNILWISICNNVAIFSYILYSSIFQYKSIFVLDKKIVFGFMITIYTSFAEHLRDISMLFSISRYKRCICVKKRGKKKNNKGYETRFSSSCRTHKEQWDTYVATHIENQFPRRQRNEIGR